MESPRGNNEENSLDELIRRGQAGELGNPENPEGKKDFEDPADMDNPDSRRLGRERGQL